MLEIILTSPATEMSEYNGNPAIAFVGGFPKLPFIPRRYLVGNVYTPTPMLNDLRVLYAPLGLRRIEASLIDAGLDSDKIGIIHPDFLEEVVGEDTRIIGISVKDPLGLGYVSLTYSTLIGLGNPINMYEFLKLMSIVRRVRRMYRGICVVVGGPGVWQLVRYTDLDSFGIDTVIVGEGEEVAVRTIAKLLNGEPAERVVHTDPVGVDRIPCIRGATIYGAVEITRGCGRGCQFCSPTMQSKRDIPLDRVERDITVNLANGQDKLLLVTEDLFIYGASIPWEPCDTAILKLIDTVAGFKRYGLKRVQITHINLAAAYYRRDLTSRISDKLYEFSWFKLHGKLINTVEVGIESGSPRIISRYMRAKSLPYKPEDWPRVVLDSLTYLEEHDWAPLATIIVGLPGEDYTDACHTLKLIEKIERQGLRTMLIPLIFVSLGGIALSEQPLRCFDDLLETQIAVFTECWRHNVRVWGPDYFKNYSALSRRLFRMFAWIYTSILSRGYEWSGNVAREIYKELTKLV